jgi:hypothetical protein
MVFNPGAAQTVTVDLTSLPAPLLAGSVTPYDLFTNETAPTPLARSWAVPMGAGEVRAFGGFTLGVFAPRKGKKANCHASYRKTSSAGTLQACFLECAADSKCENVFVQGKAPSYTEAPAPISCTLLGAVADPSTACTPGKCSGGNPSISECGTLVSMLRHARRCAERWATPTPLAAGALAAGPAPWPPCASGQ